VWDFQALSLVNGFAMRNLTCGVNEPSQEGLENKNAIGLRGTDD